jgi:hypothetical protein
MKKLFDYMNKNELRSNVTMVSVIGVFVIGLILLFKPVPQGNSALVYMFFGNLLTLAGFIYSFLFGSSKNESDKAKKDSE